jgi:hypothetical protein
VQVCRREVCREICQECIGVCIEVCRKICQECIGVCIEVCRKICQECIDVCKESLLMCVCVMYVWCVLVCFDLVDVLKYKFA